MFCCSRSVGRPFLDVDTDYIEYLRGLRFSFTEIARILGIENDGERLMLGHLAGHAWDSCTTGTPSCFHPQS